MKVAALYDVHGNLPALEAVLGDVEQAGVDAIVLGGDILAGPWPAETLALLETLGSRALWLRGNADRELGAGEQGRAPPQLLEWVRGQVDDAVLERLANLPLTITLDAVGLGRVLFCHATPRNDVEIRTSISPDERWREVLEDVADPVVVCGHTHVQFDRMVGGTRVVNAGSVGMPYEDEPGAYWALLGPEVELRRTLFDVEGTIAAIKDRYPAEWHENSAAEATDYFESIAYD